jgi:hypothetical protein
MEQDKKEAIQQMTNSLTLYEKQDLVMGSPYASNLTPALAFESSPNIRKLTKLKGQGYPVTIVTKLLSDSLMFVKHKLQPAQMVAFANMFVSGNPSLTIDELVLILTKGINGEYGRTYGDFDYMVLTEWRNRYEEGDRANYLEEKHQSKQIDSERQSSEGNTLGETIKNQVNKALKPKSKNN